MPIGALYSFIFQHEKHPKYTANAIKAHWGRKTHPMKLSVKVWPPQSKDLNTIKVLWDHVDREENKRQTTSKDKR